ncbi:hypothetical protein ABE057_02260 [Bacillus paralicheniformis]
MRGRSQSYPFALNWAKAHIPAIIYSAHGGQEAGSALRAFSSEMKIPADG